MFDLYKNSRCSNFPKETIFLLKPCPRETWNRQSIKPRTLGATVNRCYGKSFAPPADHVPCKCLILHLRNFYKGKIRY